jgi:2-phospho-L-lactate transferase/gluconeogenesis factor (CofD/UPF0052 family)
MREPSTPIKIALFCGGRGSASIIHEFLRWPNIHLTLIVNAYDDGLSTGALRHCVTNMLGPSDFRKNLSYLFDPYSEGQYALRHLLEYRLPLTIIEQDIQTLKIFTELGQPDVLNEPLQTLFRLIDPDRSSRIRHFLHTFFRYEQTAHLGFDYRDCSLGNLIFAGAYLEKNNHFNAAAKEMSQLVSSQALLVNVSQGENRILMALKEDGELLTTEATIVGPQSPSPIHSIYLMDKPIARGWQEQQHKTLEDKALWLAQQEQLPLLSEEAHTAIAEADMLVFGPGTQHSSLLPSYRIANESIKKASAPIKALIMNLEPDHDIQSLSARDIVDVALKNMGDHLNDHSVISHVLLNQTGALNKESLLITNIYKNCPIILGEFSNSVKKSIHNGHAVVQTLLSLMKTQRSIPADIQDSVSIFIDIHKRSFALAEFYEEFLEMDWKKFFSEVDLTINQTPIDELVPAHHVNIKTANRQGHFPEIGYFFHWLQHEHSEYLILLTGDGKYHFRDVTLAIHLLEQSHFGAVFGSRNQSRLQFQTSLRAAYGEKKILSTCSFIGSFLISALLALRFGIVFSDPLTGFRLFKRSRLLPSMKNSHEKNIHTSIGLATYLIKHQIEIAELPVNYRTFAGFVDPHWRVRRGIKNLWSTVSRHAL